MGRLVREPPSLPLEALRRIRAGIGDAPFLGYRINSTSFWPGDLETDDVKRIVADLEARADVDYVNLSAGVHHSFIHTPMTYEPGPVGVRCRGACGGADTTIDRPVDLKLALDLVGSNPSAREEADVAPLP